MWGGDARYGGSKTFITDSDGLGVHFCIGADLSKGIYEIPGVSVNGKVDVIQLANRYHLFDATQSYNGDTNEIYAYTDKSGNVRYFASAIDSIINPGDNVDYRYKIYELTESEVNAALGSGANVGSLIGGGTEYSAGNGITISSDNKVSVKAGTNVTVDGNGVSVTGNGSVASGNTGLINGGTAYSELRPSANGKYVKTTQTTAQNLSALDTQAKANATAISNEVTARTNADTALSNRIGTLAANGNYITTTNSAAQNLKALDDKIGSAASANGTYIKTGNTINTNLKALDSQIGALNEDGEYIQKNNNVSQNLAALDNAIDDVVNSGLQFGANSGDDVTNKIGSKVSIIGGGTKADNEYDSKNIKTIIVQDENGNTQIEIDLDKIRNLHQFLPKAMPILVEN